MDESERRALTAEYHSVKSRLNLLVIGFWIAVSLGGGLVFVGELWIGTALWVGVGLLFSAAREGGSGDRSRPPNTPDS